MKVIWDIILSGVTALVPTLWRRRTPPASNLIDITTRLKAARGETVGSWKWALARVDSGKTVVAPGGEKAIHVWRNDGDYIVATGNARYVYTRDEASRVMVWYDDWALFDGEGSAA